MKQVVLSYSIKMESMLCKKFPILLCFQKASMGDIFKSFSSFLLNFPIV